MELTKSNLIETLKNRLIELDPYLVLLFGSYAYGTPDDDSDIDLLVVTKDLNFLETYKEQTDFYIRVNKHILDLAEQVAIDLIVYTLPMYEKFVEIGSSFSKEILSKGVILYESKHARVA